MTERGGRLVNRREDGVGGMRARRQVVLDGAYGKPLDRLYFLNGIGSEVS